jgi:hypothetical protein
LNFSLQLFISSLLLVFDVSATFPGEWDNIHLFIDWISAISSPAAAGWTGGGRKWNVE